jgi:hypothetical protein
LAHDVVQHNDPPYRKREQRGEHQIIHVGVPVNGVSNPHAHTKARLTAP